MKDAGIDDLGTGPAIVTNGPPGAGKAGFQRSAATPQGGGDPPFQSERGRLNIRHFQRFLPDDEDHIFEDQRVQLEVAYASDRNFIEEYYKQLFDTGSDQETLAYGQWQKDNQYANIWTEANLQNWYTDTQWLPRVDYYRLGDSFFDSLFTYYTHSGVDYASIHTDVMVNNPNLFAFLPYDPISNTTGTFSSGRFYTNHELDMPLNFGNVVRFVPYVQGQAVGWSDQLGGGPLGHLPTGAMGRVWGAAGARAEVTAWKKYPNVESELLNVHGLNNKISLFVDARAAYSNQRLNSIAVQDDLDDNTYEYVRRYLALTQFTGGILPMPYDPRHLIVREMLSPITDTTDVQASMNTVQTGNSPAAADQARARRQAADRRLHDARCDDHLFSHRQSRQFRHAVGPGHVQLPVVHRRPDQHRLLGLVRFLQAGRQHSAGECDAGTTPMGSISSRRGSRSPGRLAPTSISVIRSSTRARSRPRPSMPSISYWLSPKWYGTFSQSYDFGDAVSLGTMFAFTRVGADYLTTIGLTVDPQRGSYTYAIQIVPRLGPGMGSGSTGNTDRYAVCSHAVT